MRETLESERRSYKIAKTLDFVKCLWYNVV